jgi:diguanylate cyclase (GGDEF)-like protein
MRVQSVTDLRCLSVAFGYIHSMQPDHTSLRPDEGRRQASETARVRLWLPRADQVNGPAIMVVRVDQADDIMRSQGQNAAEQLMLAITSTLQKRLRAQDRLALVRFDEFLLVLSGVTSASLNRIAQRLAAAIEGLRLSMAGKAWTLSCCIGMACAPEGRFPPPSLHELVREADADLHKTLARAGHRRRWLTEVAQPRASLDPGPG